MSVAAFASAAAIGAASAGGGGGSGGYDEQADFTVKKDVLSHDATQIKYRITIKNTGDPVLKDFKVIESLPTSGNNITSTCHTWGTHTSITHNQSVTCDFTYQFKTEDPATKCVINSVTVTGYWEKSGRTKTVTHSASTEKICKGEAPKYSLKVKKTVEEQHYTYSSRDLHYKITITNDGNMPLSGVSLVDKLNDVVTNISCSIKSPLQPNEHVDCTYTYTVPPNVTTCFVNEVHVSGPNNTYASDKTPSVCYKPDYKVSVTKSVTETKFTDNARSLHYVITVSNDGNDPLSGILLNDNLLSDGHTTVTACIIPNPLAPHTQFQCKYTYNVPNGQTGCVTNSVKVDTAQGVSATAEAPKVCYEHFGLKVTKAVDKTTYTDADHELLYTFTILADDANTGNITLTSLTDVLNIDDAVELLGKTTIGAKWTNINCVSTVLAHGGSYMCHATYKLQSGDYTDGKTVTNVACASWSNTDHVISNEVISTYVNVPEKITETTDTFIMHRMDRLLSDEPKQPTLNQRAHGAGRAVDFTPTVSVMGYSITASTSLASIRAANAAAKGKTPPGMGDDVFDERFNAWVEVHVSAYNDTVLGTPDKGDFGVVYAGADWLINNGLMVGFLVQGDGTKETTADSTTQGFGWMAGPYVSAELAPGVVLDLRGAWGQSSNSVSQDIMGTTWDGDFDTTRWLVRGKLSGTYERDHWVLTPSAAIAYMSEHKKAFTVSDGIGGTVPVPGDNLALGRVTIGPELAYRDVHETYIAEPYGAIRILWDFTEAGLLSMDGYDSGGLRAALEGGLRINCLSGTALDVSAMYDGLGSDSFGAFSLQGSVRVPF